jgi:site-specific DNA-methyltransferase (adenine-specific)
MNLVNQLVHGDCRDAMAEIPDNSISSCITDPPYNYEFIGHKWDQSEIDRRKKRVQESKTLVKNIPYGSGLAGGVRNERWYKRNRENILDYQNWTEQWGRELFRICKPGATVAVFNSTRTAAHVQIALENVGFYARDIVVYRRTSGIPKGINLQSKLMSKHPNLYDELEGLQSCLRSEWEAIVVLQKPLQNNYSETYLEYGTGQFFTKADEGRFQSNILEGFKRDKSEIYNVHCTVKPLSLMKRLVKVFAPKNPTGILLDPFAGSGTTLLAAKAAGIPYFGIEIEESYIPIIERRLSKAGEPLKI